MSPNISCALVSGVGGGWSLFGRMRVGDNQPSGEPEVLISTSDGHSTTGHTTWTTDLSQGFHTNWCSAELTLENPGGQSEAIWQVVEAGAGLGLQLPPGRTISKLQIRAAVKDAVSYGVRWRSIVVRFTRPDGHVATLELPPECWPAAGEQAMASPVAKSSVRWSTVGLQNVVEVTPDCPDFTDVWLFGRVSMDSDIVNTLPAPDDLLADVFVFQS